MKKRIVHSCLFVISITNVQAQSEAVTSLIEEYKSQEVMVTNIEQGKALWLKNFTSKGAPQSRSCASCHGQSLSKAGKHIKTGKPIKALAPSVNSNSLTQVNKIKKWLKRNCEWTMGRECTAQEKSNLLTYISTK